MVVKVCRIATLQPAAPCAGHAKHACMMGTRVVWGSACMLRYAGGVRKLPIDLLEHGRSGIYARLGATDNSPRSVGRIEAFSYKLWFCNVLLLLILIERIY
jgi:hypothetical protein